MVAKLISAGYRDKVVAGIEIARISRTLDIEPAVLVCDLRVKPDHFFRFAVHFAPGGNHGLGRSRERLRPKPPEPINERRAEFVGHGAARGRGASFKHQELRRRCRSVMAGRKTAQAACEHSEARRDRPNRPPVVVPRLAEHAVRAFAMAEFPVTSTVAMFAYSFSGLFDERDREGERNKTVGRCWLLN